MVQLVGIRSKKVYAEGSKADCFKKLSEDYPTVENYTESKMLPEPIMVVSVNKGLMEGAK